MKWLALDIGGANLKSATGRGYAASQGFAMWKDWQQLPGELRMLMAEAPASDHLALTMSGELADCFETKEEGVRFIVRSVTEAADGRHIRVYLNDGRLVAPAYTLANPATAAASNWHALASFATRFSPQGPALLIDIGSTTTDIIPLMQGQVATTSRTDTERLVHRELVYTGVERSPVSALVRRVPYRGSECSVAQEFFATTGDVYRILGDLPEDPANTLTADGRPAVKSAARKRLGRMICAGGEEFNHRDAVAIAQAVAREQVDLLAEAVKHVQQFLEGSVGVVVLSGTGEFLGRRVLHRLGLRADVISIEQKLKASVSKCANAHALAVLAHEATSS